ncbi:MAG: hypothetical protein ABR991_01600 [Terracidiphilus sp.]|jgi:hypothetical protein
MHLEIKSPELQLLIAQRLERNAFPGIEEILIQALNAPLRLERQGVGGNPRKNGRKSLAALFADSPFKGLDLIFDREEDTGRNFRL